VYDTLISGGLLVDPEADAIRHGDVAIEGGRIAAVGQTLAMPARTVIDASGALVTPGLVDLHAHVAWRLSPTAVDADALAADGGVTTWIDAGSAYATTIEGFREHVIDRSTVRILALLRLGPQMNEILPTAVVAQADADLLGEVASRHREVVVGIKVSMGQCRIDLLDLALSAAERAELPLMCHIAQVPPDVSEILDRLRPGDIVTHAATGQTMRLVDDAGRVLPAAIRARDRGVAFDLGHGAGSFSWRTAEALAAADFLPSTTSTDAWQVAVRGPMFDLPTCMSKLLHLGLPLLEVVRSVTTRPAARVARTGEFGTLRVGAAGDIAVLDVLAGEFPLYDSAGEARVVDRLIRARLALRAGRVLRPGTLAPLADWLDVAIEAGLDPNPQGGLRPAVRRFQEELVSRGHTPAAMATTGRPAALAMVDGAQT
jgi:dihydroorotase